MAEPPADELPKPPILLPRSKDVFSDFLSAVHAGKSETSASFEYGAQLTEFAILGNLAQHAGAGHKLQWDGPNMKVTNIPEVNKWIKRDKRQGWIV